MKKSEIKESDISKVAFDLIASDKLQEVFDLLVNFARNDSEANKHLNDLIALASRYNQLEKQTELGTLPHAERSLEQNRVVNSLLSLVQKLEKKTETVQVKGDGNIAIQGLSGSTVNIYGDFKIKEDVAKADEKVISKLIQGQSVIKILFLSSNPLNTNPLRLDREMREIENELIRSKFRGKFDFVKFAAVRIGDLQDGLLNHTPNFVHFSGHGNTSGIALLNNRTDEQQIVESEPLASLFKLFSNDVACVFLNSCYSDSQAKLIRRYIPNVIGMKKSVPDATAIEFAKVFYKGIGAGREISFSFEFAKNSIDLNNIAGGDIPTML